MMIDWSLNNEDILEISQQEADTSQSSVFAALNTSQKNLLELDYYQFMAKMRPSPNISSTVSCADEVNSITNEVIE